MRTRFDVTVYVHCLPCFYYVFYLKHYTTPQSYKQVITKASYLSIKNKH